MAGLLLGRDALPASLADAIYRHSDGNPFFVEEIVRTVSDALASGTLPALRSGVDIPLPRSASDLVERQLARVGEEARRVATLAALIGRDVPFDLLLAVSGLSEEALLDVVDELLRKGILEEVLGLDLDVYRFRHAITRSVLDRDVNRRKARKVHAAVVTAMEDLYQSRREGMIDQQVEELARHALSARDLPKALVYSLAAGQKAASSAAYETAIRFFEMAHEVFTEAAELLSADQALDLTLHLGRAYERTGRLSQAREVYEELLAALEGHPVAERDLSFQLAGVLESMGQLTAALEALDRAGSRVGADDRRQVAILLRRGDLTQLRGDQHVALEIYSEAIALAERLGQGAEEAMERIARVFLGNGEPREAGRYLERAIALVGHEPPERGRRAELLAAEAQVRHELCDMGGEIGRLEEAIAIWKALDDQLATVVPLGSLGRAHVLRGDLQKGVSFVEESLRRSRRYGVLANEAFRLRDLATVATYRGELSSASASLSHGLEIAITLRHAPAQFAIWTDLSRVRSELGRHEDAIAGAAAARALATEKRNVFWLLRAELTRADVLTAAVAAGRESREVAASVLGEADRVAAGLVELLPPPHFAPLYLAKARLAALQGDLPEAERRAVEALESLSGADLPFQRAKIQAALGRIAVELGEHDRALGLLEQARDGFLLLGSGPGIAAVERDIELAMLARGKVSRA
ncbi:MAG: hypothetical protein U0166_12700 [Acidobacteriota bacterium]